MVHGKVWVTHAKTWQGQDAVRCGEVRLGSVRYGMGSIVWLGVVRSGAAR